MKRHRERLVAIREVARMRDDAVGRNVDALITELLEVRAEVLRLRDRVSKLEGEKE